MSEELISGAKILFFFRNIKILEKKMTPEQFFKQLQAQREELKRAIARTLPVKIGNEAVNFARDNFRKEGFMDCSLKPWTPSKRKSDPKHPDRAYATLSSRRMHLYKSPQSKTKRSILLTFQMQVAFVAACFQIPLMKIVK